MNNNSNPANNSAPKNDATNDVIMYIEEHADSIERVICAGFPHILRECSGGIDGDDLAHFYNFFLFLQKMV